VHRLVRFTRRTTGRPMRGRFRRSALLWELDLDEGIDFAIWLLGAFEHDLIRFYTPRVKSGSVVLDIGANVGAHTLHFARAVGEQGCVLAFEATTYAHEKLTANIAANPDLGNRIRNHHALLVSAAENSTEKAIASSWPLCGAAADDPILGGTLQPIGAAQVATLDTLVRASGVNRVDWIKIDVDGNEVDILQGAHATLARHRPTIIIELAPYCFRATRHSFNDLIVLLQRFGYNLVTIPDEQTMPMVASELERRWIPRNGSINALAIPAGRA